MRLYAEGEDLVAEHLQDAADQIVDKATSTDFSFELGKADKGQLELLEVKHQ